MDRKRFAVIQRWRAWNHRTLLKKRIQIKITLVNTVSRSQITLNDQEHSDLKYNNTIGLNTKCSKCQGVKNLPRKIVGSNYPTTSSVALRLNYQIWNELFAWQVVFITKPPHLDHVF